MGFGAGVGTPGWVGLRAPTQGRYVDFALGWESCGYSLVFSSSSPSCIFVQENPSYKGDASDPKAAGVVRTKPAPGPGEE